MSNTQPIEASSIEESAEDRKKRKAREASAAYRTRKAAEKTGDTPENDPAEVARIEEGIKAALAEDEVLAALDEAIDIVHAGDDEDITPSPTDYRHQDDDEIAKVIQMADHDPSLRDRTRAFLHPTEKTEPTPKVVRSTPTADVAVNEDSVDLYRKAMNLKKTTKRGKGRKVTDAELTDHAKTVIENRPGAFCLHEQEIAYWVDNIALTGDRWKAAWLAAGGKFEKAPRLRKA